MSRDIGLLHPELIEVCHAFIAACASLGLKVGVSETWRSKAEQDAIYAQGRTTAGAIVSNAKYPLSPHNWGLAFDIYRNDGKGAYNDADGWFARCGAVGKTLGLFWGGEFRSFTDKPHFELKKYLPANSVNTLIARYGTPEAFKQSWEEIMTRYKSIDEVPASLRPETEELIASGALKGKGGTLGLDVTEDMLRCLIIAKRYSDRKIKE